MTNWIRSIFSRYLPARQIRRCRDRRSGVPAQIQFLEPRALLSGQTVTSTTLANTSSTLPALPNGEAQKMSVVDHSGTTYSLSTNGNVYSLASGGSSWMSMDTNVIKIGLAGNGDLVDLHRDGGLYEYTAGSNAAS